MRLATVEKENALRVRSMQQKQERVKIRLERLKRRLAEQKALEEILVEERATLESIEMEMELGSHCQSVSSGIMSQELKAMKVVVENIASLIPERLFVDL
jgi:hypothetical protein